MSYHYSMFDPDLRLPKASYQQMHFDQKTKMPATVSFNKESPNSFTSRDLFTSPKALHNGNNALVHIAETYKLKAHCLCFC